MTRFKSMCARSSRSTLRWFRERVPVASRLTGTQRPILGDGSVPDDLVKDRRRVAAVLGLPPGRGGRGTPDAGALERALGGRESTSDAHPPVRGCSRSPLELPGTVEQATPVAELGTANRLRYRRVLEVREQDRCRVLRVHERADLIAARASLDDHGFELVPHHSPSLRIRPIHA